MAVAVVTGGSRGIGAATALLLADAGWDVCVCFVKDESAANDVAARCGTKARAVHADVSSERDVRALFAVVDEMGTLGALVNNAGIVAPARRLDQLDADRMGRIMAVNVIGAFLRAGEAVRRMSTRYGGTGGVIVNVSSAASRRGSPNQYVDYAASKAAVDTMTVGLAQEVAADSVRVACVRPGLVDTGIHASGGQPQRVAQLSSSVPIGRAARPSEIAAMIAWLCSDASSYVTGAIFDVTGGL